MFLTTRAGSKTIEIAMRAIIWLIAWLPAVACDVTMAVVTVDGRLQPYAAKTFRSPDGVDYSKQFNGLSSSKVPCGKYAYTLIRTDFNIAGTELIGEVEVRFRGQWFTVPAHPTLLVSSEGRLAAGDIDIRLATPLRVVIDGVFEQTRKRWVKITEVFGQDSSELVLDDKHSFTIPVQFNGIVAITVIEERRVSYVGVVNVESHRRGGFLRLNARSQSGIATPQD
jgi:hypothetical protein